MIAEHWYQLSADEVFQQLGSTRTGLSIAEAERRLRLYGPNRLEEEERRGPWPILESGWLWLPRP